MSDKDYAGRGFDRVFSDITGVPARIVDDLRQQFSLAHSQLEFTAWNEILEAKMGELEWQWSWFDQWMTIFRNCGFWPYQCNAYMNALVGRFTPTAETISAYIRHLTDKEMREYLRQRGRYPKPAPKRWAELCAAFNESDMEELRPLVRQRDAEHEAAFREDRPEIMARERLRLLGMSLNAAAFSARDIRSPLPAGWVRAARWPIKDRPCDQFTRTIIEAFNRGENTEWPPCFPGDERWITFRTPYDP